MHGSSRFQDIDNSSAIVSNRVGFKRKKTATDETEFLIMPESFRKEICKGFDFKFVAKELKARGFLICDRDKNQKTERLPEIGTQKVYAVSSRIFENVAPINSTTNVDAVIHL
jgi:uncharacterized protein (DUF927 family)